MKKTIQGDSSFDSQLCLHDNTHKTGYHHRKRASQAKETAHTKALRQKSLWQVWETKISELGDGEQEKGWKGKKGEVAREQLTQEPVNHCKDFRMRVCNRKLFVGLQRENDMISITLSKVILAAV